MPSIFIEGGTPLMGTVNVSGSVISTLKLIPLSLFSNEDVVIENAPKVGAVEKDLNIVKVLGGSAEWVGNSLVINGSGLNTSQIPVEFGSKSRTALLYAGPLLYRFGKAFIPKYESAEYKATPYNRLLDVWKSLSMSVEESDTGISITCDSASPGNILFKTQTHMGTDNAIISSIFIEGETTIINASEESEIEDLIKLANLMGASVERVEPTKIVIKGVNIFKGAKITVSPSKIESATYALCALMTSGNITIRGIVKEDIIPFVNFLNKIDAKFEISDTELRVWSHGEFYKPLNLEISPTPGFIPNWQSLSVLLLTRAEGLSIVHDTVYVDRFGYVNDLNRMGAKIDLVSPSDVGLAAVVRDDSWVEGEPKTAVKIEGPKKLKGERLNIENFRNGAVLIVAALSADGKSEIIGIDKIENYLENFVIKLKSLGAKIWEQ